MKLRTKISTVFIGALVINIIVVIFGLTNILDSLSSLLMKRQAEQLTQMLQHLIVESSKTNDEDGIVKAVEQNFIMAKHVADVGENFAVRKILLLKPDYTVLAGFPPEEAGKSYSTHADIVDSFSKDRTETVFEAEPLPNGGSIPTIDVLSSFRVNDGSQRVIEVKLDVAKSLILLEKQYTHIETGAIILAIVLLIGLLTILLFIVGRTAIRPVIVVTHAMEKVASGDLDVQLAEKSRDEFALLARRFNEMVNGLKEKLHLSRYVSQGTRDAVRGSVERGEQAHPTLRKNMTLFFSDIRGFTTYSESRDPAVIVSTLNRILSIQASIIHKHKGDVDKFVGDEVMAVFDSPDFAIAASIEIQNELEKIRSQIDSLHIGIGIHEGEVVQGDVGSDDVKNYTVIGDTVNTAARLQSIAGPDEILISDSIARSSSIAKKFSLIPKGELTLKGKAIQIKTLSIKFK